MQRSFFVFLFSCFGVYETNRNVNQMVGASFFTSSIILSKSTSVKLHLFPKNGESFPQISSLLQRFQQGMMLQNIPLSFWPLLPEPCVTSLMARGIKLLKLAPKSVVTVLPYLSHGGCPERNAPDVMERSLHSIFKFRPIFKLRPKIAELRMGTRLSLRYRPSKSDSMHTLKVSS